MNETVAVEAVRAVSATQSAQAAQAARAAAKPSAADVARFQAAMAARPADPIPFASQINETWHTSMDNYQGILHRIKALSSLPPQHGASSADLVQLQYEVMNLTLQQEVVAKVADKASSAVTTLVRNS